MYRHRQSCRQGKLIMESSRHSNRQTDMQASGIQTYIIRRKFSGVLVKHVGVCGQQHGCQLSTGCLQGYLTIVQQHGDLAIGKLGGASEQHTAACVKEREIIHVYLMDKSSVIRPLS